MGVGVSPRVIIFDANNFGFAFFEKVSSASKTQFLSKIYKKLSF